MFKVKIKNYNNSKPKFRILVSRQKNKRFEAKIRTTKSKAKH